MEPGTNDEREAALRPLRTIGSVVSSLRSGALPPEEERSAVVQVASAAESTLRRVLRDHPEIALPIRLSALAPDELRADEVLAELRQHDRISMQLAAAVHDLLEARRRLKEGAASQPGDRALAYGVADRLEREVMEPPGRTPGGVRPVVEASPRAAGVPVGIEDATAAYPAAPGAGVRDRRRIAYWAGGATALLLLLVVLGVWFSRRDDPSGMDQGVALFSRGAYADAASHFFRYSQENPEDPLPHLYLARIHRLLKRYDLAAPELRKALELAPEDAAVHTELALLLTDTGKYAQAVPRFRTALGYDPASQTAWVGLIRALRAAGRPDAAERVLLEAPAEIRALIRSAPPADSTAA